MVLIFSANSNNSQQVLREVDVAVKENTIIVPFRIEAAEMSKAMSFYISAALAGCDERPAGDAHRDAGGYGAKTAPAVCARRDDDECAQAHKNSPAVGALEHRRL